MIPVINKDSHMLRFFQDGDDLRALLCGKCNGTFQIEESIFVRSIDGQGPKPFHQSCVDPTKDDERDRKHSV